MWNPGDHGEHCGGGSVRCAYPLPSCDAEARDHIPPYKGPLPYRVGGGGTREPMPIDRSDVHEDNLCNIPLPENPCPVAEDEARPHCSVRIRPMVRSPPRHQHRAVHEADRERVHPRLQGHLRADGSHLEQVCRYADSDTPLHVSDQRPGASHLPVHEERYRRENRTDEDVCVREHQAPTDHDGSMRQGPADLLSRPRRCTSGDGAHTGQRIRSYAGSATGYGFGGYPQRRAARYHSVDAGSFESLPTEDLHRPPDSEGGHRPTARILDDTSPPSNRRLDPALSGSPTTHLHDVYSHLPQRYYTIIPIPDAAAESSEADAEAPDPSTEQAADPRDGEERDDPGGSAAREDAHGVDSSDRADALPRTAGSAANNGLRVNPLPLTTMDLAAIRLACHSPRGRGLIHWHTNDGAARRVLRPLQPHHPGTITAPNMSSIIRQAIAYQNYRVVKTHDHAHRAFLRRKKDGSARLLFDGTDYLHPNAVNQRLPHPLIPPALWRVASVLVIIMSGSVVGVDDVRTCFPQMPLCPIMQMAHGVTIRTGRAHLRVVSTRVTQGARNSPALAQYTVLTLALVQSPILRHPDGATDYHTMSARARRVVHIDDVVSSGISASLLDQQRLDFRQLAEQRYQVVWKEFTPSAAVGSALGIRMDCERHSWTMDPLWVNTVVTNLARLRGHELTQNSKQWLMGIAAWVCQIVHVPLFPISLAVADRFDAAIDLLLILSKAAMTHNRPRSPEQTFRHWPRGHVPHYTVSDACRESWAGASTDGTSECGYWYDCVSSRFSATPCCSTEHLRIENAEVYYGEALASIHAWLSTTTGTSDDWLIASDSQIWVDNIARAHASDLQLAALLVVLWLAAPAPIAAVHVPGDVNPAHEPSHGPYRFAAHIHSPPAMTTTPRWSVIGTARACGRAWIAMRDAVIPMLPCGLREQVRTMHPPSSDCIYGCMH